MAGTLEDVTKRTPEMGHRLEGDGPTVVAVNRFLEHLGTRSFSPATVRAYAFDLANFARCLEAKPLDLSDVADVDLFEYLDWQVWSARNGGRVVAIRVGCLRRR